MFHPLWATLTTIGAGAASWVAVFGGRREAWVPAAIGGVAGRKAVTAKVAAP